MGELREDFVDEPDLRGEGVRMDVFCEEAADVACLEGLVSVEVVV